MMTRSPIDQPKEQKLFDFTEFRKSQQPLEPEFEKVFWDNYWDLLA